MSRLWQIKLASEVKNFEKDDWDLEKQNVMVDLIPGVN